LFSCEQHHLINFLALFNLFFFLLSLSFYLFTKNSFNLLLFKNKFLFFFKFSFPVQNLPISVNLSPFICAYI